MKNLFPSINTGKYATVNGNFYEEISEGKYKAIELYLPCNVGTNNEPIEQTAIKWLAELNAGTRATKRALGVTGATKSTVFVWEDNKMKACMGDAFKDAQG